MNLKRRLLFLNISIIFIPVLITLLSSMLLLFTLSKISNMDVSYENIKSLSNIQYELFIANGNVFKDSPDMFLDKNFQKYIGKRLNKMNAYIAVRKGQETIFSTKQLSLIDVENCLNNDMRNLFENKVNIDGKDYDVKVKSFIFNDGEKGNVILLAPINSGWVDTQTFLIIVSGIFILSFIITNIILILSSSKRILKPIDQLKEAASKISGGNLDFEVIESGDAEVRELCRSFEEMRLKLKESENVQKKYDNNRKMLLSSISHDIKTPMTSIKGYVEGILDGVADNPQKLEKYLRTIYSKTELIDKMIDDLFLYSKLDLKKEPFNFEKTDIQMYFEDYVNDIAQDLKNSNIDINLHSDLRDKRFVMMDKDRFKRTIINIIENSKKYMDKEYGEINIKLRETDTDIVIEVKDNGKGISENDLPYIFDRFYRADSSRSSASGTGLGLAIAKQIIQGHDGKIWARKPESHGTSIIMSINKIK